MLTEKDYCDFDTCVALEELGFNNLVNWYFNEEKSIVSSLARYRNTYIPRISLYEAQKWLREIHNIFVMIDRSFAASNSWHYVICANDDFEHLIEQPSLENYSYEEALSEGIKEAIKILSIC